MESLPARKPVRTDHPSLDAEAVGDLSEGQVVMEDQPPNQLDPFPARKPSPVAGREAEALSDLSEGQVLTEQQFRDDLEALLGRKPAVKRPGADTKPPGDLGECQVLIEQKRPDELDPVVLR